MKESGIRICGSKILELITKWHVHHSFQFKVVNTVNDYCYLCFSKSLQSIRRVVNISPFPLVKNTMIIMTYGYDYDVNAVNSYVLFKMFVENAFWKDYNKFK